VKRVHNKETGQIQRAWEEDAEGNIWIYVKTKGGWKKLHNHEFRNL
jgi:hypothetical protein